VGLKVFLAVATGSLGVLSEALHSGLDLVAAILTWFSVRLSDLPADSGHTYGHGKIESFSAFVETGLLLATSAAELPTASLDGAAGFAEVIARNRLVVRDGDLRSWAHWVTPEFEPRRYDTRFFVVALDPHLGELRGLDAESDELAWVRPADALAAAQAGRWQLMPPTEHTLRDIAGFTTTAQVLAAAAVRRVERWLPTLDPDAEVPRFVITRLDPVS